MSCIVGPFRLSGSLLLTSVLCFAVACSNGVNSPAAPTGTGVSAGGAAGAEILAKIPAFPVTIGFNDLTGNGSAFTSYTESGFRVSSASGSWTVKTSFGHPAPFISFNRSAGQGTISAEIMVKAEGPASAVGGPAFRFGSIDLYSSITTIPYVFTGLRSSNVVFTETGTVPNTFGNFATVLNPRAG